MFWYPKSIQDINHGPECFSDVTKSAIANNQAILHTDTFYIGTTPEPELNICDLQTKLIQLTGRYCERYASDLLCTLSTIEAFTKNALVQNNERWVIGIGLRENGVDHNEFIVNQLVQTRGGSISPYVYPSRIYRKLLLLDITDTLGEAFHTRTFTLIDATHLLTKIDPEKNFNNHA